MEQQLHNAIFEKKRERVFVEEMKIGGVIIPIIRLLHYNVYVYGYDEDILSLLIYLENNGINIRAVIVPDEQYSICNKIIDTIPVISVSMMLDSYKENPFVFINTHKRTSQCKGLVKCYRKCQSIIIRLKVCRNLKNAGIKNFYEITSREKDQIYAYSYTWTDSGRMLYYRNNYAEIKAFFHDLKDKKSKETMIEYIRAYMQSGIYHLPQCDGRMKYFCGHKDSCGNYENLYTKKENEVWINCGSNIGDSICLYYANGFDADTIYGFEGNKKTYKKLCDNIALLPKDKRDRVKLINEFIGETTDFEKILMGKRVSLVNADIEGSELDLLKSLKNVINKDRPVLAISAYHRASDFVDFTNYIKSIVDNYEFVLRKYPADFYDKGQRAELVWYAIPTERRTDDYVKLRFK